MSSVHEQFVHEEFSRAYFAQSEARARQRVMNNRLKAVRKNLLTLEGDICSGRVHGPTHHEKFFQFYLALKETKELTYKVRLEVEVANRRFQEVEVAAAKALGEKVGLSFDPREETVRQNALLNGK